MLVYCNPDSNTFKIQKGFKTNFTKGFLPYKSNFSNFRNHQETAARLPVCRPYLSLRFREHSYILCLWSVKLRLKFVKLALNALVGCQNTVPNSQEPGKHPITSVLVHNFSCQSPPPSELRVSTCELLPPLDAQCRWLPFRCWNLPLRFPETCLQRLETWWPVRVPVGFIVRADSWFVLECLSFAAFAHTASGWMWVRLSSLLWKEDVLLGGRLCREITVTRTFSGICSCRTRSLCKNTSVLKDCGFFLASKESWS